MRLIIPIALVFLIACTGCGTVANMRGESVVSIGGPFPSETRPFGGVRQDVSAAFEMPGAFVLLADLPFSLAGDLVTLPWVAYENMRNGSGGSDQTGDEIILPASASEPAKK